MGHRERECRFVHAPTLIVHMWLAYMLQSVRPIVSWATRVHIDNVGQRAAGQVGIPGPWHTGP